MLDPHAAKVAAKADLASKQPVAQFVIMEHAMAATLVAKVNADIQVRARVRPASVWRLQARLRGTMPPTLTLCRVPWPAWLARRCWCWRRLVSWLHSTTSGVQVVHSPRFPSQRSQFVCVCFIASEHTLNLSRLQQYTPTVIRELQIALPSLSRVAQIMHSVQAVALPMHTSVTCGMAEDYRARA